MTEWLRQWKRFRVWVNDCKTWTLIDLSLSSYFTMLLVTMSLYLIQFGPEFYLQAGFDRNSLCARAKHCVRAYCVLNVWIRMDCGEVLLVLLHHGRQSADVHILRDDDGGHYSERHPGFHRQLLLLHALQSLCRILDSPTGEHLTLINHTFPTPPFFKLFFRVFSFNYTTYGITMLIWIV